MIVTYQKLTRGHFPLCECKWLATLGCLEVRLLLNIVYEHANLTQIIFMLSAT